jgi:hypothetical protein
MNRHEPMLLAMPSAMRCPIVSDSSWSEFTLRIYDDSMADRQHTLQLPYGRRQVIIHVIAFIDESHVLSRLPP